MNREELRKFMRWLSDWGGTDHSLDDDEIGTVLNDWETHSLSTKKQKTSGKEFDFITSDGRQLTSIISNRPGGGGKKQYASCPICYGRVWREKLHHCTGGE